MRQELTPQLASVITLGSFEQNDVFYSVDALRPGQGYAYNNLLQTRANSGLRQLSVLQRRIQMPVEVVEKSFKLLQTVLDSDYPNILGLIELLYKGVYGYTCHQLGSL